MKKLALTFLFSALSFIVFSQENTDTLKYEQLISATKKPSGDWGYYLSKNGDLLKLGDKIILGMPSSNKTFAFIYEGDGVLIMQPASVGSSGANSEIRKIMVSGLKSNGFKVTIRGRGLIATMPYFIDYENALASGEVKSNGMTSDEALAELKRSKDKLDLGIITQNKYDSLKTILIKYIK